MPDCGSSLRPTQTAEEKTTRIHRRLLVGLGLMLLAAGTGAPLQAQQKIGHVDTEYILNQMPEYSSVKQKLDRLERQWRDEIQAARDSVQSLQQEFEAREVLYTEEERERKRAAIEEAKKKVQRLREQYFGPDGELYTRQKELMRPLQNRILEAAERVATDAGYDYIVDKKGETLFLFAKEEHSLSDRVLRQLGINVEQAGRRN